MKVKVGEKVYDAKATPVMVILSDLDKANIARMLPECDRYACFPEEAAMTQQDMLRWMRYGNM